MIAERNPPSITYSATVAAPTQIEKLMSHPRMTFITSAIAYMFTPDIRMVMNPNEIAASPRAPSPNRSCK